MDITLPSAFSLRFANGRQALALEIDPALDLSQVFQVLALPQPRPVLVLVGGASGLEEVHLQALAQLFQKTLCPWLQAGGFGVIDGGTQAGIMQLMGEAYVQTGVDFPLVGVAARGTVALPQETLAAAGNQARLEPNHPFFCLVSGQDWGDEAPWIAKIAQSWAGSCPSVTLVVNGGGITFQDVAESVRVGRPVVVMEGSGRTADLLAAALQGDRSHEQATQLVQSGLIHRVHLNQPPAEVVAVLDRLIAAQSHT